MGHQAQRSTLPCSARSGRLAGSSGRLDTLHFPFPLPGTLFPRLRCGSSFPWFRNLHKSHLSQEAVRALRSFGCLLKKTPHSNYPGVHRSSVCTRLFMSLCMFLFMVCFPLKPQLLESRNLVCHYHRSESTSAPGAHSRRSVNVNSFSTQPPVTLDTSAVSKLAQVLSRCILGRIKGAGGASGQLSRGDFLVYQGAPACC